MVSVLSVCDFGTLAATLSWKEDESHKGEWGEEEEEGTDEEGKRLHSVQHFLI